MAANAQAKVSERVVTGEPLYILFNLGMSEVRFLSACGSLDSVLIALRGQNFGFVDLENLVFPSTMRTDYIRVYQKKDQLNVGCSPPLFPTAEYIGSSPPSPGSLGLCSHNASQRTTSRCTPTPTSPSSPR